MAVSDQMLTIGGMTAEDAAHKSWWIHRRWCAFFAGDAAMATPILDDARHQLVDGQSYLASEIGHAVSAAWIRARVRMVEATVLSAYGLTMKEFVGSGANHFQPSEYTRLCVAIEAVNPDCDFLVCGFKDEEDGPYPHVMAVQDGVARDFDALGYWAIGSGADLALGTLAARRHSFRYDTATALYSLLEARFVAESDPNVGRGQTFAVAWGAQGVSRHAVLSQELIDAVKQRWVQHRSDSPPGVVEFLGGLLAIPPEQPRHRSSAPDRPNPKGASSDQPPSQE